MAHDQKRIRALRARVVEAGGEVLDISRRRHIKIVFKNPKGATVTMVCAASPSDWRGGFAEAKVLRMLMERSP